MYTSYVAPHYAVSSLQPLPHTYVQIFSSAEFLAQNYNKFEHQGHKCM